MHRKLQTVGVMTLLLVAGNAQPVNETRRAIALQGMRLPTGTEIVGLRDAYSRHRSNGDGTITAEIHAAPINRRNEQGDWVPVGATDDITIVYPDLSGHGTGYTVLAGSYSKVSGDIRCGVRQVGASWQYLRGHAKFNTGSIPDMMDVTHAILDYYVYYIADCDETGESPAVRISLVDVDPLTAGAQTLYDAVGSGEELADIPVSDYGWAVVELNQSGARAIEDGLGQDWVAFGWYPTLGCPTYLYAFGYDGDEYQPYLLVTYTQREHDVGVSRILAPVGAHDTGAVVVPACSVYNRGRHDESYRVRMKVGGFYDQTATVTAHAAGGFQYLTFPAWTVEERGTHAVSCSTELATDEHSNNDKKTTTVSVRLRDVGAASILSPAGSYPFNAAVSPVASWYNYGTDTASFETWLMLEDPGATRVYAHSLGVTRLAAGARIVLDSFPACTLAAAGAWKVRCSTALAGDMTPDNDTASAGFFVGSDVGAASIDAPRGQYEPDSTLLPRATWRMYGTPADFEAWMMLSDPGGGRVYAESTRVVGLGQGRDTTLAFPAFNPGAFQGPWTVRCSTYAAGDLGTNDVLATRFTVARHWPEQWVQRYNGEGDDADEAMALAVDDTGNSYIAGPSYGATSGPDYALVKYDGAGGETWEARYNGPGNDLDACYAIAVDAARNVYVAGQSYTSDSTRDYTTIRYNAAGDTVWVRSYNGPGAGIDIANAIALDGSGNVYVTGKSPGIGNGDDYATVKYDPAGTEQWVRRYDGPGNGDDAAQAIALDGSGNVYVTGKSPGIGTGDDYATVKYDPAGTEQWTRTYNGPGNGDDAARAIALDGSGNACVTGKSPGIGNGDDYATVKYDPAGVEQWVRRYNGPGNGDDAASAIAVDGSGSVYVTGTCLGSSADYDCATVKYDPAGAERWVAHFNGTANGDDAAEAIAVDDSARVLVTGSVMSLGTGEDGVTLKYDSAGALQMAGRYSGTRHGSDRHRAIALGDSGDVFVAGLTNGPGADQDFVLVKYGRAGGVATARDVGVSSIVAPVGPVDSSTLVTPACSVYNYGVLTETYAVRMKVGTLYDRTVTVADHAPGTYRAVVFPGWNADVAGSYVVTCSTELGADVDSLNNRANAVVLVVAPGKVVWFPAGPMPSLPSGKSGKDGGWLAFNADNGIIYAAKGNKTTDFYGYSPETDSWKQLAAIPMGRENKLPSKGAVGCADGAGVIYATKGNNTQGFYKYLARKDSWYQLSDVPLGITRKKVKGGTDLAYVQSDTGYVYLLKGYRNEFWRYYPDMDQWTPLAPAPAAKYDKGSWLAYVPEARAKGQNPKAKEDSDTGLGALDLGFPASAGTIYAHQAKYHGFYAYDLLTQSWGSALAGMPLVGRSGRSKKSKDGGSAAYLDGLLFALKGGNTQEFWQFTPPAGPWTERETLPQIGSLGKKKKVKAGADITATFGELYALKGNKSNELWRYAPGQAQAQSRSGVMASAGPLASAGPARLTIVPNPLRSGFATLVWETGAASLSRLTRVRLYDAAGRLVHSSFAIRASSYRLDLRSVPAGVYIVRLDAGNLTATHKLVVQR